MLNVTKLIKNTMVIYIMCIYYIIGGLIYYIHYIYYI